MHNSIQREDRGRNTMMLMNEALFSRHLGEGLALAPLLR